MMKAKPKKDLGIVCENMWKAAGNNLKIPTELKINLDKLDSEPLFKVEPAGQTKIGSEVFTTFAGNSFPLEEHKRTTYSRVQ